MPRPTTNFLALYLDSLFSRKLQIMAVASRRQSNSFIIITTAVVLVFQIGVKPALLLRSTEGKVSISSLLNIFLSLCIRLITSLLEKSSGIK